MIHLRAIAVLAAVVLATTSVACAAQLKRGAAPEYSAACQTTGPTGAIDARALLDITDVTTFRASEFTDCDDGRDILVVSWRGQMDVTNVNLARDVARRFFGHFRSGEQVTFTEVHAVDRLGISTVVFQFFPTPRRSL